MYVAVKGGEKAIGNAHRLLAEERRGDPATPELSLAQIEEQLSLVRLQLDKVIHRLRFHGQAAHDVCNP